MLAAVVEIVREDHFFPKVARIRESAARIAAEHMRLMLTERRTPSESIYAELVQAWNREIAENAITSDAFAVVEHLGGWAAIEAMGGPTLPDVIRAFNAVRDRVLVGGAA